MPLLSGTVLGVGDKQEEGQPKTLFLCSLHFQWEEIHSKQRNKDIDNIKSAVIKKSKTM